MRYTKVALLIFGFGLVLGFVAVVGDIAWPQRLASAIMALGLALIPIGAVADTRGIAILAWLAGRLSRKNRVKPRGKPARKSPVRRTTRTRAAARAPRRRRS